MDLYLTITVMIALIVIVGLYVYYNAKLKRVTKYDSQENPSLAQVKVLLEDAQATIQQQKNTIQNLTSKLSNAESIVPSVNIQTIADNFKKEKMRLETQISELESQVSGLSNNDGSADLVKKLQSEIKKLKQDLEDAQDDLDDAKSKFKKEKAKLETDLSEKENETKKLKEANSQLTEEINDLQKTVSCKNTSLEFVQEILTAKPADKEEHIRALHKAIDNLYNYIDEELYSCCDHLVNSKTIELQNDWKECYFGSELKHWALNQRKTWLKGKTTIALIGEFSSGKTSIVNRLLSQDSPNVPLLPVSTKATTAIPTYISGGPSTSYRYYSPDNQLKSISESTFTKVNKEVLDEVKGVSQLIKYFVMSYNNPILEGLSVLDTPGFNSNDNEDTERTIDVINECDALFWVIDINQGDARRQSLDLIKQHLTKPLFVIINKVDTKSKTEIQAVEDKLRDTFQKADIQVQGFIRFSQKEPLSSISEPLIKVKTEQTEFDFIQEVVEMVKNLDNKLKTLEKNALNDFNDNKKKCERKNDAFKVSFKECSEYAKDAVDIPQWTSHVFRRDGFEMDEDNGYSLIKTLKYISEKTATIHKDFQGLIDSNKETQTYYETYCKLREEHKQINKCLDNLIILTKKLK